LGTERIIGTVDETGAFYLVHSQAVYLHDAETYFVEKLDLEKKVAFVQKRNLDYYTQAVSESNIVIDEEDTERPLNEGRLGLGEVTVTTMLPMFKKIKFASRDSIGFGKLDLPPQQLNTRAVWLIPPAETVKRVTGFGRTPVDGLVGIANVLVDIARLHIMCDPSDIGTVVDSTNRGSPTLFVYDRYEGGMGFAQRAYRVFEAILEDTLALVRQCDCDDGCPSCVGAPVPDYAQTSIDSGTHDVLPDKEAALVMLHDILDKEPYIPAKPPRPPGAEPGVARPNAPMDDLPAKDEEDDPVDVTPLPDHLAKLIRQRIKRLKD
jgi:DEAD/DEAH box helicase domain-containing protein